MSIVCWRPRREWDPFAGLTEMQQEINRSFGESLARFQVPGALGRIDGGWMPTVDIYEDKDNVHVKADLPGLSRDDVEIAVQDHFLTIKGEKKHEAEVKDENYYRVERAYGTFSRTIELPAFTDDSKVTAKFRDGVLDVCLPKTPEAKPKRITIQAT